MDGKIAAVALAIDGALGMGRPQLAALCNGLAIGRIGALCCWEHLQPLSKYAMYAQNEQVHVASWPSFSLYDPFAPALGAEVNNAASRVYAVEGSCFVLAPCATVSQAMIDELCDRPDKHALLHAGGGFAAIYGPDGSQIGDKLAPRSISAIRSPS
ncbi:hypothetical protein GCM10007857_14660 [Bradyrhizobium iriomotense]|uniref:CN hydrolase domain-containing protein n=1 Tax=Bradyrhizobium iriomotense TaxID=441950 RepID=A0ABQ6AX56_9BRAD|nr:hypothetical protein GCM10007857_14660 [Bradyrhizobium iriomotense]